MADYLIENSLIGSVSGNIFLEFYVTLKLYSEQFCLKLPIVDIQKVSDWWTIIHISGR